MFFNNYSKPGKGVNKRDPNQPRVQIFFDILPRKIWDLFKLNLLYLSTSIPFFIITIIVVGWISLPLVDLISGQFDNIGQVKIDIILRLVLSFWFIIFLGQGPTTAGYTYIIREYGLEHPCWIVSDFFEKAKANFKQSILLWIIDLVMFSLFTIAFEFYSMINLIAFQYIIFMISIIYVMFHIYVYQMLITFDLSLKSILKNSFLFAVGRAPVNLLIIIINVVIYMVIPFAMLFLIRSYIGLLLLFIIFVLILPPITSFATNFYIYPLLHKYINVENKIKEDNN